MPDNPLIHYVKFQRGTEAAYTRLKELGRLDNDTLYFIYASANATRGVLYLGEKLISGSVDSGGGITGDISIADLADVVLDDDTLANHQLLTYKNGNWVNTSLADIISTALSEFTGATTLADGTRGLVPQPKIGDQNKFLSGDGTWKTLNIPEFSSKQFETDADGKIILKGSTSLEENLMAVSDGSGGIKFIPIPTGTLNKEVVDSVDDIDLTATDKIYIVRSAGETPEDDKYSEFIVVNGELERIGGSTLDLSGYATETFVNNQIKSLSDILNDTEETDETTGETTVVPGLISQVSNLALMQEKIGDLSAYSSENTLVDAIDDINERLAWVEISEE